jgi:hypothetical protein
MKKQTAVEWMVEQVELISNNKTLSKKDAVKLYDEVIQKSKAMEMEQIIEAYLTPLSNEYWFQKDEILNQESKKYYNETYKDKTIESYE